MVESRFYRNRVQNRNLQIYEVQVQETDLLVSSDSNLYSIALECVLNYRYQIENYIRIHHEFLTSLAPISQDRFAPKIIQDMIFFSEKAGVGPMASVAGAIAQYVASDLGKLSENVIIENGGDDYIISNNETIVSIYAGKSPLSDKIKLKLTPEKLPVGICTSSGTVGHSLSFGRADAVCVLSKSAILADAAATAIANRVKDKNYIEKALNWGMTINDIIGVIIIMEEKMGLIGEIELA